MQRNIADFIEEKGAAIGLFKLTHVVRMRISECPLHVAEQLTFKECFRNGAGIYGYHWFPASEAVGVYFARQYVLAGAVLAGDQYSGFGRSNLLQRLPDGLHGSGGPPEHRSFAALRMTSVCHAEAFGCFGRSIFPHRLPGFIPGRSEHLDQFVIVPGLHDEVEGPTLHPFHRQGDIGISGKEHYFHFGGHLLDLPGPIQSLVARVDAGVEVHVQQHHIRPELLQRRYKGGRRGDGLHLGKMHRQQNLQRPADAQVVINH